jgi:hypothetical protein
MKDTKIARHKEKETEPERTWHTDNLRSAYVSIRQHTSSGRKIRGQSQSVYDTQTYSLIKLVVKLIVKLAVKTKR